MAYHHAPPSPPPALFKKITLEYYSLLRYLPAAININKNLPVVWIVDPADSETAERYLDIMLQTEYITLFSLSLSYHTALRFDRLSSVDAIAVLYYSNTTRKRQHADTATIKQNNKQLFLRLYMRCLCV